MGEVIAFTESQNFELGRGHKACKPTSQHLLFTAEDTQARVDGTIFPRWNYESANESNVLCSTQEPKMSLAPRALNNKRGK